MFDHKIIKKSTQNTQRELTTKEICSKIINHINSTNFDSEFKQKLKFLEHKLKKSFLNGYSFT